MHVIGGTASTALAERISRELGNAPFGIPFTKRFPDEEMYVRVGGRLEGEDVVVVQSTRTDADFLELIFSDEVTRRDGASAARRARAAGLDPAMRLDRWDDTASITYDRQVLDELFSLRFVADGANAIILGPVGVGKTHLACALGHIAIRRRRGVHMARAGKLFKRLKAARLDNTPDYEIRRPGHRRAAHHR